MSITTTLNEIRKHNPCQDGWEKLLQHMGKTKADDEPLTLLTILESNGLDDCLWALRTRRDLDSLWRHVAVDFACYMQDLMTDERSKNALRVARRYADGEATNEELREARSAARAAADAARDAYATYVTARSAAYAAAYNAVYAACYAVAAAYAYDAARAAFTDHLRNVLEAGERVTPPWMETKELVS